MAAQTVSTVNHNNLLYTGFASGTKIHAKVQDQKYLYTVNGVEHTADKTQLAMLHKLRINVSDDDANPVFITSVISEESSAKACPRITYLAAVTHFFQDSNMNIQPYQKEIAGCISAIFKRDYYYTEESLRAFAAHVIEKKET